MRFKRGLRAPIAYFNRKVITMSSDIETLLQSVRNGETLSFEAIYQLYLPLVESTVQSFS